METTAVEGAALGAAAAHDLSVWGLFLQADIVVKAVMLSLVLASFWTWAIIFEKTIRLRRLRRSGVEVKEQLDEAARLGPTI